jgi:hypothetical protein
MNRRLFMVSARTRLQSSGLIQSGSNGTASAITTIPRSIQKTIKIGARSLSSAQTSLLQFSIIADSTLNML